MLFCPNAQRVTEGVCALGIATPREPLPALGGEQPRRGRVMAA